MVEPADTVVPVLEIGGTHVTAALVSTTSWTIVPGTATRTTIRPQGTAADIVHDIARAAATLGLTAPAEWAVAIPGPFDYERGIGLFENVGKFDSLYGVDVRAELTNAITPAPTGLHFLNDADAYGVGEYAHGAGRGARRLVCITLGTGVGSAFVAEGVPVTSGPTVPHDGEIHLIDIDGVPIEGVISQRAIRSAYAQAAGLAPGDTGLDVHEIAELARSGDPQAAGVLDRALTALGGALAPILLAFEADALVMGGSISRSWDLVHPAVRAGLAAAAPALAEFPILPAEHPDDAPVVGAAYAMTHLRG
jgi:glucokinase